MTYAQKNRLTNIVVAFGTRPEAIKMAPVILALRQSTRFNTIVCVTAQHRELLDSVLRLFKIVPDFDLNVMRPDQSLDEVSAGVIVGMGRVLDKLSPSVVLVHGDTTTTMAASLA